MSWASIILGVLRILQWLIGEAERLRWLNEGEKRAVARGLAELVRKQEYARETLASIERLSDEQLDDLLRELATPPPDESGGKR